MIEVAFYTKSMIVGKLQGCTLLKVAGTGIVLGCMENDDDIVRQYDTIVKSGVLSAHLYSPYLQKCTALENCCCFF